MIPQCDERAFRLLEAAENLEPAARAQPIREVRAGGVIQVNVRTDSMPVGRVGAVLVVDELPVMPPTPDVDLPIGHGLIAGIGDVITGLLAVDLVREPASLDDVLLLGVAPEGNRLGVLAVDVRRERERTVADVNPPPRREIIAAEVLR